MDALQRVKLFRETLDIVADGGYRLSGRRVKLHSEPELCKAIYISEEEVLVLIDNAKRSASSGQCCFHVEDEDTLECARIENAKSSKNTRIADKPVLVLNFASPVTPGGGVLDGARSQEEELCRRSTLYASLTSDTAAAYYENHRAQGGYVFTHGAILSPCVDVFRNPCGTLMDEPFTVAVITMAAPYAPGLQGSKANELQGVFETRIEGLLRIAIEYGYERLVLGAWGCGVFGNDPAMVAEAFLDAFKNVCGTSHEGHTEGSGSSSPFTRVCFAVLDSSSNKAKCRAFERVFGNG